MPSGTHATAAAAAPPPLLGPGAAAGGHLRRRSAPAALRTRITDGAPLRAKGGGRRGGRTDGPVARLCRDATRGGGRNALPRLRLLLHREGGLAPSPRRPQPLLRPPPPRMPLSQNDPLAAPGVRRTGLHKLRCRVGLRGTGCVVSSLFRTFLLS